jgi:hypothetical protein
MLRDGLNAIDLGILGDAQYAVNIVGPHTFADIWQRPAAHVGTYGGWRWECSSKHPETFAAALPWCAELARRLAVVRRYDTIEQQDREGYDWSDIGGAQ